MAHISIAFENDRDVTLHRAKPETFRAIAKFLKKCHDPEDEYAPPDEADNYKPLKAKLLAKYPAKVRPAISKLIEDLLHCWMEISSEGRFMRAITAAERGKSTRLTQDDMYFVGMGPTNEAAACAAADLNLSGGRENEAF